MTEPEMLSRFGMAQKIRTLTEEKKTLLMRIAILEEETEAGQRRKVHLKKWRECRELTTPERWLLWLMAALTVVALVGALVLGLLVHPDLWGLLFFLMFPVLALMWLFSSGVHLEGDDGCWRTRSG